MNVEQQRARRIGRIGGVNATAGQPPQQITIDRAEREFTAFGPCARARDMIEQPCDLGAGKIRIDDQAGALRHQRLVAVGFEFGAEFGGAAILPDDGAVDGAAGGAVPHHGGLALIGDADRCDIFRRDAGFRHRIATGFQRRGPDVLGLMFDPAGCRKMLREFLLRGGGDRDVFAKHDRAR